jgi:DNA adenine methylase
MKKIQIPTFIKWAGGKTQLLNQYSKLFPKPNQFTRYFEPMIGSGAVFFYIKQKFDPDFCMISDINKDLINLYIHVRDESNELIHNLKKHKINQMANPEAYYYSMRRKFNETKEGTLEKSALFVYLNKTCYNGLFRVNAKGEFNVPFGRYKHPPIVQENNLKKASKLLKDVDIVDLSFEKIINYVKKDDFLYFDPPYRPLSETSSFTSYQKNIFSDEKQIQLSKLFKKLDEKNCLVMLSNSDHELVRKWYKDYDIQVVKATRMISCKANGRGKIAELVIRNY